MSLVWKTFWRYHLWLICLWLMLALFRFPSIQCYTVDIKKLHYSNLALAGFLVIWSPQTHYFLVLWELLRDLLLSTVYYYPGQLFPTPCIYVWLQVLWQWTLWGQLFLGYKHIYRIKCFYWTLWAGGGAYGAKFICLWPVLSCVVTCSITVAPSGPALSWVKVDT